MTGPQPLHCALCEKPATKGAYCEEHFEVVRKRGEDVAEVRPGRAGRK
jgi:hypothetical protein